MQVYYSPSGNVDATVTVTQNSTGYFYGSSTGGANLCQFFPVRAGYTYRASASQPGAISLNFMPKNADWLFPSTYNRPINIYATDYRARSCSRIYRHPRCSWSLRGQGKSRRTTIVFRGCLYNVAGINKRSAKISCRSPVGANSCPSPLYQCTVCKFEMSVIFLGYFTT